MFDYIFKTNLWISEDVQLIIFDFISICLKLKGGEETTLYFVV